MTQVLSPEELRPTPAEQQVDPNIIDLPEQRATDSESLFTPRIMTFEESTDDSSRITSVAPVSEGTKSVLVQPRIMTMETTDEPAAEPTAEEAVVPAFAQTETDVENSATVIPGIATVVKPVRRQKERPARAKASVRKRERKATVAAQQSAVPATAPVAESNPSKGTKEPQKISMIGGLAMAKMTGGRLAFRKPSVKLPRRNKAVIETEKPSEEVAIQAPKKSFKEKLAYNVSPSMLMLRARTRAGQAVSGILSGEKPVEASNESTADKEHMSKKRKGAIALGVLAVGAIAYANHKGFDFNPFDGAEAVGETTADSGITQAAAEQATAPEKFDNAGVTPKGAGVSTAPVGSAEAAEIASALAETAEVQIAPEIAVVEGDGFTDLYQNTASQLGVELNAQELMDMHTKVQAQFGGDIITGDTYMMSDGNYGISSPGKTSWNPDAQRFFEDLLEEAKKKKSTS